MAEINKKLSPFESEMIETAKKVLEYKIATEANVVSILYKSPDKIYDARLTIDNFSDNVWNFVIL